MGGKGGGGGNYYQPGPDTSGNATLEEAKATLASKEPLDMSGYQQNINVKKAAADATAKPADIVAKATAPKEGESGTSTTPDAPTTGDIAGKAVLMPPGFWADYGKKPGDVIDPTATTTQI